MTSAREIRSIQLTQKFDCRCFYRTSKTNKCAKRASQRRVRQQTQKEIEELMAGDFPQFTFKPFDEVAIRGQRVNNFIADDFCEYPEGMIATDEAAMAAAVKSYVMNSSMDLVWNVEPMQRDEALEKAQKQFNKFLDGLVKEISLGLGVPPQFCDCDTSSSFRFRCNMGYPFIPISSNHILLTTTCDSEPPQEEKPLLRLTDERENKS